MLKVLEDAKMKPEDVTELVLLDGKELSESVSRDEVAVYGAAMQGAILDGIRSDVTNSLLAVDVTPLSLGIETVSTFMSVLIKCNTAIPVRKTRVYKAEEGYLVYLLGRECLRRVQEQAGRIQHFRPRARQAGRAADNAKVPRRIKTRNDLEQFIYHVIEMVREKGDINVKSAIRNTCDWFEDHEEATLRELEVKKYMLSSATLTPRTDR
ncbi:chaperone DnaK [Phytophthora cinnamomi]|uniref:chaperone DnaK n=1 Tax=Phytophthora cinnamomi TaxID=4785 RepID=UPI00355A32B0|nr:chaperone DnaK [Phytophthora cinnamomi]KAG6613147.1 chaperone DnaK [Phytophthora cinnamomi]